MSGNENDNIGYLGKEFQSKFLWQLLTDNIYGENIVEELDSSYIDDNFLKRLIILYKNYYDEFNKVPSILNNSIIEIVNEKITDNIEKETLLTILKKIRNYNKKVSLGQIPNDGDVIQKKVWRFIKQQKYLKLAKQIISNTTEGNTEIIDEIEFDLESINKIGVELNLGESVIDNIDETVEDDYRDPISTGIDGFDQIMGGGLGPSEMGFILAPLGTGKTTLLSIFANAAFLKGKNVIQIFFEDNYGQVKRKHYTCFTGFGLKDYEENKTEIKEKAIKTYQETVDKYSNRLDLLKLSQDDNVTIPFIKKRIKDLEKLRGVTYDMVVLDYIDCVESHRINKNDDLANELTVIKAFEAFLSDTNKAGWSAFQGNRTSIDSEVVGTSQLGGNIKKAQKTHFLVSIAKTGNQKEEKRANIKILKSRFGSDGMLFENSLFDNEYMKVSLNTSGTSITELLSSGPIASVNKYDLGDNKDSEIENKFQNIIDQMG
jgi:hypothetical protein